MRRLVVSQDSRGLSTRAAVTDLQFFYKVLCRFLEIRLRNFVRKKQKTKKNKNSFKGFFVRAGEHLSQKTVAPKEKEQREFSFLRGG